MNICMYTHSLRSEDTGNTEYMQHMKLCKHPLDVRQDLESS